MPTTITVDEAQGQLKALIDGLSPGAEIIITANDRPVARLVGEHPHPQSRPAPGLGKGTILYMSPDFDEPMDEFKEHTG